MSPFLFFLCVFPLFCQASEPEKLLTQLAPPYTKYFSDRAKNQDPAFPGFTNSFLLSLQDHGLAAQAIIDHGGASYDQSILGRIGLAGGSTQILDTFVNYASAQNLADVNNPVFNCNGAYYGAGGPNDKILYGPYRMIRISGRYDGTWWNTWDWMVDTGSASCLIIDALSAYQKTSDIKYKNLAILLAGYISKLKDTDGSIRYGPRGMYHDQGSDFFWNLKSTEQNERCLAAFLALYSVTGDNQYNNIAEGIKTWLKGMYRKEKHLFYASASYDGTQWVKPDIDNYVPTDVTAFAPLELMASDTFFGATQAERDAEIAAMFATIESKTAFLDSQNNPDFFRFSVSQTGDYGSVEWSAQMALAYLRAAQFYTAIDWDRSQTYLGKYKILIDSLENFFSQPADDLNAKIAPYASYYVNKSVAGNVPTGTGYYTYNCQAALASCYYLFAKAGYDPLKVDGGPGVMSTLNLVNVPWYQNSAPYSSTGAASVQMISNFIRIGTSQPELTQNQIYEYAKGSQVDKGELTPDEMSKVLGHFDPYDVIVSNWSDNYDNLTTGNPYQGYNFGVDSYDPSTDSEAFNKYIRDICHWMAYTVTQNEWWSNGVLVSQPNCPAALPIGATYDHWVVIKGFATSTNPTPNPHTNPFEAVDFTVYGLWIKDPLVNGLGQDTYKTSAELKTNYLLPLSTGDNYQGKYVQVAEPPPDTSKEFQAKIAAPVQDLGNLEFVGIKTNASGAPLRLSAAPLAKKATKRSWKDIVDKNLLADAQAQTAFSNTQMGKPLLVKRLDREAVNYYLVPFNKIIRRSANLTSAVVILDEKNGYFKEASWTKAPEKFPRVSKIEAINLVKNYILNDRITRLRALPKAPQKTYANRLTTLNNAYLRLISSSSSSINASQAELYWAPNSKYSLSPYKPYWRIDINGYIWYVTQEGKVFTETKIEEIVSNIQHNRQVAARLIK